MLGIRGCGVSLQPFSAKLTGATCRLGPCGASVALSTATGLFLAQKPALDDTTSMTLEASRCPARSRTEHPGRPAPEARYAAGLSENLMSCTRCFARKWVGGALADGVTVRWGPGQKNAIQDSAELQDSGMCKTMNVLHDVPADVWLHQGHADARDGRPRGPWHGGVVHRRQRRAGSPTT
jgi:hypothetical protein